MPTLRNALIVGLGSEQRGREIADAMQHLTGTTNGITVGASTGVLGFFGAAVTTRPSGVTVGNVTAVANALANLGLIATTT